MRRTTRKLAGAVVCAALLVTTHSAPAHAATVVVNGVPDGWSVYNQVCGSPDLGTGSVAAVAGPAASPPPLGTGSLRLHQGDTTDVVGVRREVPTLAGISELGVDVYDPSDSTYAIVGVQGGSGNWQGAVRLGGDWTHVDLLEAAFTWLDYSQVDPGPGTVATIDEFIAERGDSAAILLVVRATCGDGTTSTNSFIDGLTLGEGGNEATTYDFEGAGQAEVTMNLEDDTIRRGDNVVVTGKVDPAVPGGKILLKRKTATGSKKVGAGVVAQNGRYKITQELNKKGKYELFTAVPATSTTAASKSPTRTLTVRR